ncbi:multicopper oxidase family protein [Diaminobutyricimonas sp. TR449]|uniref:multicopper oxidase family protein n=1 Tax=Diaminobutyricimonas sp. TR449 TaxID=2708076 RepID=UPI00141DD789|nr:multicopper oxidase family protein [Diaminobutyricimonas sp. TR449]
MPTQLLLGLDLALVAVGTGLWLAGAVLALRSKRALLPLLCAAAAVAIVLGRIATTAALAAAGWWFAAEKVLLALPLAIAGCLVAIVLSVPPLWRGVRLRHPPDDRARIATGPFCAGYASVAGLVTTLIIGYPMTPIAAVVLIGVVVLVSAVTWAVLTHRGGRTIGGLAGLTVLVLLAGVGYGWLGSAAGATDAAASHGHGPQPPQPEPPPAATVSVDELRTPPAAGEVVRYELEARVEQVRLASGTTVNAWTFGSLPGPAIEATLGQTVEVELRNRDIDDGVTVHWHGYDVPNGEDGVAGVTQDAVLPGESFTYRFAADQLGSYWFHTHQHSAEGVRRGLYGTLVVRAPDAEAGASDVDLTLPFHTIGDAALLGASDQLEKQQVAPGERVLLRLMNTDQVPRFFRLSGTPFRVVAVDGRDIDGATDVERQSLRVPAGGRLDVAFTMPQEAVSLRVAGAAGAGLDLVTGDSSAVEPDGGRWPEFNLLTYGSPGEMLSGPFDVDETLVLDRTMRFLNGMPAFGYTVNGAVYPLIPATRVTEGDLVRLTVVNRGSETHPMHPHGHHVLVLSRNGVPMTGAPLWMDTFDVQPGEVWQVAFRADNPGIWLDHCHNLDHAAEGMLLHLAYTGVSSPFQHGGPSGNTPE